MEKVFSISLLIFVLCFLQVKVGETFNDFLMGQILMFLKITPEFI